MLGTSHAGTPVPQSVSPQPLAPQASPPPVNPAALNYAPTPIPAKPDPASPKDSGGVPVVSKVSAAPSTIPSASPPATEPTSTSPLQFPEPTIAETGVPVSAGTAGPGPKSGSLKDLRSDIPPPSGTAPKFETAEEEKTRLQKEERERLAQSSAPPAGPAQKYETAEEEKRRLEKEEKERLLKEEEAKKGGSGSKDAEGDGATPPPYQEF